MLEIAIAARGLECAFHPKFHCELNYIESFWSAVKRYTRQNCNYSLSFVELEDRLRLGLPSLRSDVLPIGPLDGFREIRARWYGLGLF